MIQDKPTFPPSEWERIFEDSRCAREYLERSRWPDGAWCVHCGLVGRATRLSTGKGLWKCWGCRRHFTVTVGTILEDTHLPLNQWMLAIRACVERSPLYAADLRQVLAVSYKTARLLGGRLAYAIATAPLSRLLPVRKPSLSPRRVSLSLAPLPFEQAVKWLLAVKPEKRICSAERLDRRGRLQESQAAAESNRDPGRPGTRTTD